MNDGHSLKEIGLLLQGSIAKLDQFMADNKEEHCTIRETNMKDHQDMNITLKEHNGRLRKSEQWQERIMGGVAMAGILIIPFLGWYLYYTQSLLGKAVEATTVVKSLEAKVETLEDKK